MDMNNEETEGTPHAIPVADADSRDYLLRDIQEATVDVRSFIRIEEPEVTMPTRIVRRLVDDVDKILNTINIQERRSLSSLYIGTLLGALIGVMGNFFVSFWFQPQDFWNYLGLFVSGILLFLVSIALFFQARKYAT